MEYSDSLFSIGCISVLRKRLADLSLHSCPALLLLFASSNVLILLTGFCKGLQELVEYPEELIRLHLTRIFTKVIDCL